MSLETGVKALAEAVAVDVKVLGDIKVDKVAGYSLVDDDEIAKLITVEQDAQKNTVISVAGRQGDVLLDKSDIGLSAVDNTADADKPVSTAVADALDGKVDAEAGKQLSDENYTSPEKSKLAGIQAGAQVNAVTSVSGKTGTITLTKEDIGLSNVDNTSDINKPISNPTQAALDNKVDKQAGKVLSDTNFTQAEKDKLSSLESSKFVGLFVSDSALPLPGSEGDYANVDGGVGSDVYRVIWDSSDNKWVRVQGVSTELTDAQIKQQYESNPDTNAFTDDEKAKLADIASEATKNRSDTLNADKAHTHVINDVTDLQTALDGKVGTGDTRLTDSREWIAATVTQPVAEAGTSTDRLAFTSQRVRQSGVATVKSMTVQTTGQSTTDLMSQKAATDSMYNIPSVPKSTTYTATSSDKGKSIDTTAGVTLPASVFDVGDVIVVTNTSASNISITPAAGVTLRLAGSDSTGVRTLAGYGVATLRQASVNVWFASGAGLS